jgi:hypothetical protein
MRQIDKDRLQTDLIKFCKQIGIIESDIPKLIFDRKEMNAPCARVNNPNSRSACNNAVGLCSWPIRTIWISERPNKANTVGRHKYVKHRDGWYRYSRRKKWTYSEQRHTLVHELVHCRFPK